MKNIQISNPWYYSILTLIILFSYFNFSPLYNPLLDSSTALTILMTPGYSIPGNLYLWGQNFSGSLVSFLAQLLVVTYRFPPAMAVSIIQYLILGLGFLALSTFFRTRAVKLMLAVIWFFPVWHFTGFLTSPFGLQLSLLALGFFTYNRLRSESSFLKQILWLSLTCIAWISAVWVSDLSLISLLLWSGLFLWGNPDYLKFSNIRQLLSQRTLLYQSLVSFFWFLVGTFFILLAKHFAGKAITYTHPLFANPADIFDTIKIVLLSLFRVMTFSSENIIESIYAWAFFISVPLILHNSIRKPDKGGFFRNHKWQLFFLSHALVLFILTMTSHWVYENGVDRKYFSLIFISFWIFFLLFYESTETNKRSLRDSLYAILITLGMLSAFVGFYIPKFLPARHTVLSELKSLQNIGIIGESNTVYLAGSLDPDHIKVTPHEKEFIRNYNLVGDVFKQKRIYLIKDNWLSTFPDTIMQFNFKLQRTGTPFKKGGMGLCRYERFTKRQCFYTDQMKYQGEVAPDSNAIGEKSVKITSTFDRSKHFIYGPFIHLPQGKYTVIFRIKSSRDLSVNNLAVLDISANFGKEILTSRTIRMCDFSRPYHFDEFDVPLEITKEYDGVEFRIMYLGQADLFFDRVVLSEK